MHVILILRMIDCFLVTHRSLTNNYLMDFTVRIILLGISDSLLTYNVAFFFVCLHVGGT